MQTPTFFKKFLQSIAQGVFIGIIALSVFYGGLSLASNSGGEFGKILEKILVDADYTSVDENGNLKNNGMVKNALQLDGKNSEDFVQLPTTNQTCPDGQYIAAINKDGSIVCK